MAREIRVTFTDKEEDLYNFIKGKSSASNFIKDLVKLEKERQANYTNPNTTNDLDKIVEKVATALGKVELKQEANEEIEDEYVFDIDDIIKK